MVAIDYDLSSCLHYNPQYEFKEEDIAEVLAVWEGKNDGDDWRWILRLKDGRFVYLQGGCDYTGWDCQSYAVSEFADSAENVVVAGDDREDVTSSLKSQLVEGKARTWREDKDDEFGNPSFIMP